MKKVRVLALVLTAAFLFAACGSDDSSSSGSPTTSGTAAGTSAELTPLTIGYSAWPGWFP